MNGRSRWANESRPIFQLENGFIFMTAFLGIFHLFIFLLFWRNQGPFFNLTTFRILPVFCNIVAKLCPMGWLASGRGSSVGEIARLKRGMFLSPSAFLHCSWLSVQAPFEDIIKRESFWGGGGG